MKKIEIISLKFRNFKGIKNFLLETDGRNVSVYGDNAVGKTTIFDGFTWMLFDKDSQNKKDFEIKTLDKQGNALHNLEHEVEGVLLVDGRRRTLRKVFTEKWTKKRGSALSEFTGHTTDYFIDGIPSKKSEYEACVDGIVSENIFKLLTNPAFFNEQLDKKERRKILLEVCGDMSDAEVISNNPKLVKLPTILGDRSIDDHRKVIAAKRAEINKELEKIPIRIDEANRSKPDISELDEQFLTEDIATLKERIQAKEAEMVRMQSGGEIAVREKQLHEIEGELQQLKNELQAGTLDKVSAQRRVVAEHQRLVEEIETDVRRIERKMKANEQQIADLSLEKERLGNRFKEENTRTFSHNHDEDCPTCGQKLPEEKITEAVSKAEASFNQAKAERLEQISTKGKATAAEIRRLQQENEGYASEIEKLSSSLAIKREELRITEDKLNNLQSGIQDVANDPVYLSKVQQAEAVKKDILGLRSSIQDAISSTRLDLAKARSEVGVLEQEKAKFAQAKVIDERIIDLQQQEKQLASEFERLEEELFLTEEFVRTKVSMLESKINSKFKFARFKLFEPQINGGLSEVCETLYNGVPYSSGLNNAARINVGLDIINTLSVHYGFSAPIFIDNAEAVTKLLETKGQQISLVVSEKDKQLRVENGTKTMQEAV